MEKRRKDVFSLDLLAREDVVELLGHADEGGALREVLEVGSPHLVWG